MWFMVLFFLSSVIPGFLFMGWANHTYFCRHSELVLKLFSPVCEDDERLISFSIGKPNAPVPLHQNRWYFLFSTKRIYVIYFTPDIVDPWHIENAVLDGSIVDKIGAIYMCGYGNTDSIYGGRLLGTPIPHINYTRLVVNIPDLDPKLECMLEHRYAKNGQLIRRIFDAAKNKSTGARKAF